VALTKKLVLLRKKSVYNNLIFWYNTIMKFIKDLLQATILAALFFGPLFYYFLFMMKP